MWNPSCTGGYRGEQPARRRGGARAGGGALMIDPAVLHHHLTHARPTAELIAQLVRLDPELAIPAALPLLAARLLGATGSDTDDDELEPERAIA